MQKGFAGIIILTVALILAGLAGAYYFGKSSALKPQSVTPKACTAEAMVCPDGSAVGRTGPNCEFQPCPSATSKPNDVTANWKTFSDDILSFNYPSSWEVSSTQVFGERTVVEFKYKMTPLFTLSEIGNYNQGIGKPFVSLDAYIGKRIDISKDILIGASPAKRITAATVPPELSGHVIPYEEVVLFTPDKSLLISLYYEKDYFDKTDSNKVLDQILSTFKFKDPHKITVKLYFYNSNFDHKRDCLEDAVLPVEREIPRTETPIKDTIELLLRGVTPEESAEGFGSEFPYAGFKLLGASLNNGVLNLNFPEISSFTSGGSCRVGLLNAQLDKTAKQFPEVKEVTYNNQKWGMFQP